MRNAHYEVHLSEGGRWIISTVIANKDEALAYAQTLLKTGKGDAVRVIEENARGATNTLFEQKRAERREADLTIASVDSAPLCSALPDFYRFPARRTAGRLFRAFLEKQGITILELLYDRIRLSELARLERYLNQGIQRVADLQTQADEGAAGDRIDVLWSAVTQIRERTKDADCKAGLEILDQQGLDAMLAAAAAEGLPEETDVRIGGVLAAAIGRQADWMGKVGVLLDFLDKPCSDAARRLVDEILSEILDGGTAVRDLLGGQRDVGTALLNLTRLATGQWAEVRWAVPEGARLNVIMGRTALPETRAVLLGRITRNLLGLQPLSREDDAADRAAFTALLTALCSSAGLWGGGPMSEAIVRRMRMTFGNDNDDLSFEQAQGMLLGQFPSGLVRLGFLLDISTTSLWERNQGAILKDLLSQISRIRSLADLLPPGSSTEFLGEAVRDLTARFKASALPEEAGVMFAAKMAQFLREAERNPGVVSEAPPPPPPPAEKKGLPRRTFAAGEYLFREGDAGSEAYIITSGEIEILRRDGDVETPLALLERGAILGEMALIDDQPRMATARVRKDAVLTIVPRAQFKAKLERTLEADHVVGLLIKTFVERLRQLPHGGGAPATQENARSQRRREDLA